MNILDLTKKGEGDYFLQDWFPSIIFTSIEDEYFIESKMKRLVGDSKIVFNYIRAIFWGNFSIDKIITTDEDLAKFVGQKIGKNIDYRVVCSVLSGLEMMGLVKLEANEDFEITITKRIERESCFSNLFSNFTKGK